MSTKKRIFRKNKLKFFYRKINNIVILEPCNKRALINAFIKKITICYNTDGFDIDLTSRLPELVVVNTAFEASFTLCGAEGGT